MGILLLMSAASSIIVRIKYDIIVCYYTVRNFNLQQKRAFVQPASTLHALAVLVLFHFKSLILDAVLTLITKVENCFNNVYYSIRFG